MRRSPGRAATAWQLRSLTWHDLARMPGDQLVDVVVALQALASPLINTDVASPRGYVAHPETRRTVHVGTSTRLGGAAVPTVEDQLVLRGPLIGRDELAILRRWEQVRVDEHSVDGPCQLVVLVASLAVAGVPLDTTSMPTFARGLLSPAVATSAGDDAESDDVREGISIAQRRQALARFAQVELRARPPQVAVVVPTDRGRWDDRLAGEMSHQTWPNVRLVSDTDPTPSTGLVARLQRSTRYGPCHIEDLVRAMTYSGAAIVSNPHRYSFDDVHGVLHESPVATEVHGNTDASLGDLVRYRAGEPGDGPRYAHHGCNAIALVPPDAGTRATVLRELPPQLGWSQPLDAHAGSRSYFGRLDAAART